MSIIYVPRKNRTVALDLNELKSALTYDPFTGEFIWVGNGKPAGYFASNRNGTWKQIGFKGERYSATHLAWVLVTGRWPKHRIGHHDGNAMNLKWSNLFEDHDNLIYRSRAIQSNNTSGVPGVYQRRSDGLYEARIHKDGELVYLGTRRVKEDAEALRIEAERLMDYHPKTKSDVCYAS